MQQAIIRLIVLGILLINQALVTMGWNPLPYSEEEIYTGVSSVATVVVAVWTWYKNNSVTSEAQAADDYMKKLKGKE